MRVLFILGPVWCCYKKYFAVSCDVMLHIFGTCAPFQRNLLPPLSGLRNDNRAIPLKATHISTKNTPCHTQHNRRFYHHHCNNLRSRIYCNFTDIFMVYLTLQRGVMSTACHGKNITRRGVTSTARHAARSHSFVYILTT